MHLVFCDYFSFAFTILSHALSISSLLLFLSQPFDPKSN